MVNKINKKIKNPKNKMKLPNGFGSISFLGQNRRNPFMMRAPAVFDEYGRAKRTIIGYTDDWYKAMEALIIYNKDPLSIEKKELTFEQIYNLWSAHQKNRFKELKEKGKLPKTKKRAYAPNYDSVFHNQCKDLHQRKIVELCTSDFQKIVDDCDKGYSTRRYIKLLGKQLFLHSIFLGLKLDINVIDRIELGEIEGIKKHNIFSDLDIQILWQNLGNTKIDPENIIDVVLITLFSGMRPTELLEQKTAKIDLKTQIMIGGIKTNAGIDREIPIHDKILPLIKKRYDEGNKYLITKKDKSPFKYRHFLKLFKDLMEKLNMEHIPYDCRATVATKLYNAGIDELIYKLILGHAINDVTEKHYISISRDQKVEAINKIN